MLNIKKYIMTLCNFVSTANCPMFINGMMNMVPCTQWDECNDDDDCTKTQQCCTYTSQGRDCDVCIDLIDPCEVNFNGQFARMIILDIISTEHQIINPFHCQDSLFYMQIQVIENEY